MKIFHCTVTIYSSLSLDEVGVIVSTRVLGGTPMGGREEYIRDEVPAIFNQNPVLGLEFILQGEPNEEGYDLSGEVVEVGINTSPAEIRASLVDISDLVASLLQGAEGIEVFVDPPFKPGT